MTVTAYEVTPVVAASAPQHYRVDPFEVADVFEVLEDEGVEKFIVSWNELVTTVEKAIH